MNEQQWPALESQLSVKFAATAYCLQFKLFYLHTTKSIRFETLMLDC